MVRGNLLAYHDENKNTWKYSLGTNKFELFSYYKDISTFPKNKLLQFPFIHVCFLIKSSLAKQIKVPNLSIGEDPVFLLSCLTKANKIVCLPDILYYYRVGHPSISNASLATSIVKNYDYIKHLLLIKDIYIKSEHENIFSSYLLTCVHRFQQIKQALKFELNNMGFYIYFLKVFDGVSLEPDLDIATKESYKFILNFIDEIEKFISTETVYKNTKALIKIGIEENLEEKKIWLINERGWDAGDNGLVFYKYIKKVHPEINAYYVITKDSYDF